MIALVERDPFRPGAAGGSDPAGRHHGPLVNCRLTTAVAAGTAAVIIIVNVYLLGGAFLR